MTPSELRIFMSGSFHTISLAVTGTFFVARRFSMTTRITDAIANTTAILYEKSFVVISSNHFSIAYGFR
jgi:hypothetical protein